MYQTPTLPHLLALLLHSPASFPERGTRIIVVDTISAPFERAYAIDERSTTTSDASRWASGRKFAVMGGLVRSLGKIALLHNLAVLLLCQSATKLRQGAPAILLPAISGHEWETGISTRIALYRDWPPTQTHTDSKGDNILTSSHYATVCKVGGSQVERARPISIPFVVTTVCSLSNDRPCRVPLQWTKFD